MRERSAEPHPQYRSLFPVTGGDSGGGGGIEGGTGRGDGARLQGTACLLEQGFRSTGDWFIRCVFGQGMALSFVVH